MVLFEGFEAEELRVCTLKCESASGRFHSGPCRDLQIQYFSRAFQPLRNSFLETIRAVIIAVRWFLVLLLVTLWGFAGAHAGAPTQP